MKSRLIKYWDSLSYTGMAFGGVFFVISLLPSLLPRAVLYQGVLSALAFVIGYGAGQGVLWLWNYLEIPLLKKGHIKIVKTITNSFLFVAIISFLSQTITWQNSIRELMGLEKLAEASIFKMIIVASLLMVILLWFLRKIAVSMVYFSHKLRRIIPRRISNVLSFIIVSTLLLLIARGILGKFILSSLDSSFSKLDQVVEQGVKRPIDNFSSGGNGSLIRWDTIGREGQKYVVTGPSKEDIRSIVGTEASQPLRTYVGLRSHEDLKGRAKLALAEMKRIGSFEKSTLVIISPTGTGWIDSSAVDTLEYLHKGDVATVGVQYSYLQSWVTLLVDPNQSRESSQVVFAEIYNYWRTLPVDNRPELYLYGLSLGSLSSETSAKLYTTMDNPIQGALWVGPPFASTVWADVTARRNSDSPAWLPKFEDGSLIRFTGRESTLNNPEFEYAPWGSLRIIYLQHSSDPIVFFSENLLFHKPDWLVGQRGPDVSEHFRWFPIVTFLQVALDVVVSTSPSTGYGHNYAPESHIDAWISLMELDKWSEVEIQKLKAIF